MNTARSTVLWLMLFTVPALADTATEDAGLEQEGPLSPCIGAPDASNDSLPSATDQWVVQIATTFSKEQAIDAFDRVKQNYTNILADYEPIVVEHCNLSMGNKPQYSARIVMASRASADTLCSKLQQSGGACLVQKD
jgi:hypothetical protein